MQKMPKYFIVEADALPEIFLKVSQAKGLLETGEASTVNQAAAMVGISRSAFYKYKDAVRPFNDMKTDELSHSSFPCAMSPGYCPGFSIFLPRPAGIFSPSTRDFR